MAPSAIHSATGSDANHESPERLCQIVTPVGMLGYGFQAELSAAALEKFSYYDTPTAIILDSGSTDSGPSKLALGNMTCPRASYMRDIGKLLQLVVKYNVPLITSSAGGDGADEHVDEFLDIIREISERDENRSWRLKVLAIYSGVSKALVFERLAAGQISGCGPSVPKMTTEDVEVTPRIVAQMGPEPFMQAMAAHPDFNIIIGGRAYDPSPYIAYGAYHALKVKTNNIFTLEALEVGSLTHMGKIMECGGLCATPKGMGAMAIMNKDLSFDITPLDPTAKCTTLSVAAHTLYEKTRPDMLHGPGGCLDLTMAKYKQLADGVSVRIRGSTFHSSRAEGRPYTVKLEGARVTGFRTLMIGSFRDPILIPQIHSFLANIRKVVEIQHVDVRKKWDLQFHVYGEDNRPGALPPREIFIVAEAIADSQDVASSLVSTARVCCAHLAYPGQKATSGSFAMGIGGKFELETRECAEFSIYHLMNLKDNEEGAVEIGVASSLPELFRWKSTFIGRGETSYVPEATASIPTESVPSLSSLRSKSAGIVKSPSPTSAPKRPEALIDIASIIRSKNAGPYEITLDVVFNKPEPYYAVKASGLLSAKVIADLHGISEDQIVWCGFFDVALAFKATIPRMRNGKAACSGGYMESDVHGAQGYVPLMELKLNEQLVEELEALKA